ncbi:hypothetical protein B0H17DRAFT_1223017 [Mycena rosella]|uniref:DUF8205 domain-containing protein n=1 Tax=Mycena rosella TaxID=1033263 RepID=A0AAD7AWL5_MYCRO|nr:hypothetical protein B0H17DRAFT_1223017 [Mycena rosella]
MENWQLVSVQILATSFDMVRTSSGLITMLQSLHEGCHERPLTVESCLQFINHHIRSDEGNQLRLRTKLRDIDVQVIKAAACGNKAIPAEALRSKMAADATYS